MNITGSALASWWHSRLPKEDGAQLNEVKQGVEM
jgi:hypothetical protein